MTVRGSGIVVSMVSGLLDVLQSDDRANVFERDVRGLGCSGRGGIVRIVPGLAFLPPIFFPATETREPRWAVWMATPELGAGEGDGDGAEEDDDRNKNQCNQ